MIKWESTDRIWADFSGNPVCHLCGENPGTVYKKSHERKNGVYLEASVMYCHSCVTNRKEEVSKDFETWWSAKWAHCEATAEKNWQEKGIYTNVGYSGHPSGLSGRRSRT